MPEREDRRQRRIRRRKKEILAAAAPIFAEKGYRHTTAREIAEAVDLAEGTLYHYFGSKEEILVAVLEEVRDDVQAIFRQADGPESRQDLIDLVAEGYQVLTSKLAYSRTLLLEAWQDDAVLQDLVSERMQNLGEHIRAFIAGRIARGVFRPVDPSTTARMIVGMFVVPVAPVMRGIQPAPSPEECRMLAESVVDLVFDGLCVRQEAAQEAHL